MIIKDLVTIFFFSDFRNVESSPLSRDNELVRAKPSVSIPLRKKFLNFNPRAFLDIAVSIYRFNLYREQTVDWSVI